MFIGFAAFPAAGRCVARCRVDGVEGVSLGRGKRSPPGTTASGDEGYPGGMEDVNAEIKDVRDAVRLAGDEEWSRRPKAFIRDDRCTAPQQVGLRPISEENGSRIGQ